jgi:hypothetical protein
MTLADRPVTVTGTLSWLPLKKGTSPVIAWVLIADAVVLAGAAAATGLFARHRRATRATGANNINNTTQDPSTSPAAGSSRAQPRPGTDAEQVTGPSSPQPAGPLVQRLAPVPALDVLSCPDQKPPGEVGALAADPADSPNGAARPSL